MTNRPSEYPWSSARWHGFGKQNEVVQDHPIYIALGRSAGERTLAYRELFRTEMDEDLIHEMGEVFSQEKMLGSSRFLAQVERTIGAVQWELGVGVSGGSLGSGSQGSE